jgi:hypothetical protein
MIRDDQSCTSSQGLEQPKINESLALRILLCTHRKQAPSKLRMPKTRCLLSFLEDWQNHLKSTDSEGSALWNRPDEVAAPVSPKGCKECPECIGHRADKSCWESISYISIDNCMNMSMTYTERKRKYVFQWFEWCCVTCDHVLQPPIQEHSSLTMYCSLSVISLRRHFDLAS